MTKEQEVKYFAANKVLSDLAATLFRDHAYMVSLSPFVFTVTAKTGTMLSGSIIGKQLVIRMNDVVIGEVPIVKDHVFEIIVGRMDNFARILPVLDRVVKTEIAGGVVKCFDATGALVIKYTRTPTDDEHTGMSANEWLFVTHHRAMLFAV